VVKKEQKARSKRPRSQRSKNGSSRTVKLALQASMRAGEEPKLAPAYGGGKRGQGKGRREFKACPTTPESPGNGVDSAEQTKTSLVQKTKMEEQ